VKATLAVLLETLNPLALVPRMDIGCLAGNDEAFGEFGDGVVTQLVICDESFTLFAHDDTSPGHSAPPP